MNVPTRPAAEAIMPRAVTEGIDERLIRRVVDRFYAQARKDEIIGPIFRAAVPDERWRAHLDTIVDFWSSMLLGTVGTTVARCAST